MAKQKLIYARKTNLKHFAFTLAEVLIALAVVGIVAAITIPSLVQKYNEKVTITKVKKAYSILQNAFQMAVIENGTPDQWNIIGYDFDDDGNSLGISQEGSSRLAHIFAKYINKAKICEGSLDCIGGATIRTLGGRVDTANGQTSTSLILNDGTYLSFTPWNNECNSTLGGNNYANVTKNACGAIGIKTNSKETHYGVNYFVFYLLKDRILPFGSSALDEDDKTSFYNYCIYDKDNSVAEKENGLGCTGWVIEIGNMDYRRCDGLSYDGKHKCD